MTRDELNALVTIRDEDIAWQKLSAMRSAVIKLYEENERLRADLAGQKDDNRMQRTYVQACIGTEDELRAELAALRAEIEAAPVVYRNGSFTDWNNGGLRPSPDDTHRARLVRIEKLP